VIGQIRGVPAGKVKNLNDEYDGFSRFLPRQQNRSLFR